jgi:hypothetical protein
MKAAELLVQAAEMTRLGGASTRRNFPVLAFMSTAIFLNLEVSFSRLQVSKLMLPKRKRPLSATISHVCT